MKQEKPIVNFDIDAGLEGVDPRTISKGIPQANVADKVDYREVIQFWIEKVLLYWDFPDIIKYRDGFKHCLFHEFPNLDLRTPILAMDNYLSKYYRLKKELWLRVHATDHIWDKQFAMSDFEIEKARDLCTYMIGLCAKHRMLSLGAKSTYGGSRMESSEEKV